MAREVFDQDNQINLVVSEQVTASTDIWLIHGFTESSESLTDIFANTSTLPCNIYIPDLPGFGKSHFNCQFLDLYQVVQLLDELINKCSYGQELIIIGHSLGGTLATELVAKLDNVKLFLNIEGMLIADNHDARSLTRAVEFTNPQEFVDYVCSRWADAAQKDIYINRYVNNILQSDPTILHGWAKSSVQMLANNRIGQLYRDLTCKKIYVRGERTLAQLELSHLLVTGYEQVIVPGVGHWPMLEDPERFWRMLTQIILDNG